MVGSGPATLPPAVPSRQLATKSTRLLLLCRHDVYMLLERKLREPLEFSVDSVRCDPAHRVQLDAIEAEVMHLLRAEPFAIIVCHADFEASSTFCASLHDIEDGGEIVTCSSLPCMQERLVAIRLAYGALRHEEEAFLELSPAGHITWLYYARVKAICHESFAIRMGFLTSAARKIVLKHSFKERKERDLTRLADLPPWREPGRRDSGQDVALLAAKRAIKRLPKDLLAQLRQRYIEGRAWSEIAQLRGVTEVKVRKDDSRLMEKLAEAFVAGVPEAPKGALPRVVKWLKEMLPQILERE
jgi:hypothetical protein